MAWNLDLGNGTTLVNGRPEYAQGGQGSTALHDNIWSQSELDSTGYQAPAGATFSAVEGQPGNYRLEPIDYNAMFMEQMERSMEMQAAMMEMQMAQQASYMADMQALQQEQLLYQQEQANLMNTEAEKSAGDYLQANTADTARRQMLRRGLMSTYTRYPNSSNSGGTPKSSNLGGSESLGA